jgi:hypothetical protein
MVVLLCGGLAACNYHSSRSTRSPVEYDVMLAEQVQGIPDEPVVEDHEVRRILSRDAGPMLDALNEVSTKRPDHSALPVLIAAWEGNRNQEPNLNWDEMYREDVRFALAYELMRAHVKGAGGIPVESITDFARSRLNDASNPVEMEQPIYLLALAGDDNDIARVQKLLETNPSPVFFFHGVTALGSSCSPLAASALDAIVQKVPQDFEASLLKQQREKTAAFRAKWCDARNAADESSSI